MSPEVADVKMRGLIFEVILTTIFVLVPPASRAGQEKIVWNAQEKPIVQQISSLRSLPDDVRARTTKQLALQIRELPAGANKLTLANSLANLSTEGDFGRETLQEVTTTLADALREHPVPEEKGHPAAPYIELAELVRYEHMRAASDSPEFSAAMAKLSSDDKGRQHADFTLTDLEGKSWTLSGLRGKVVVVNFWATWCPPCRKEMPDLETLYNRFKGEGLVVLAISDEDAAKVRPFIAEQRSDVPDPARSGSQGERFISSRGNS